MCVRVGESFRLMKNCTGNLWKAKLLSGFLTCLLAGVDVNILRIVGMSITLAIIL